jgi:uncharacterized protein YdhG (YjbR/CyaY superfamily)
MTYEADTVEQYITQIQAEHIEVFRRLRSVILENIPKGFEETISYKLPSFVVPLSIYPAGYRCKKNEPLPFISIASQKNFIAFYHMGIYSDPDLLKWFSLEYAKLNIGKLDMGKSCIRLKNMKKIPYELLGELCGKITVKEWIETYNLTSKHL